MSVLAGYPRTDGLSRFFFRGEIFAREIFARRSILARRSSPQALATDHSRVEAAGVGPCRGYLAPPAQDR
jgi:hypothetical protein